MNQTQHAKEIASRFKEIVELSDDSLAEEHYDELALLIEAGLDTAIMQRLETVADQLTEMANAVRHDAEFLK